MTDSTIPTEAEKRLPPGFRLRTFSFTSSVDGRDFIRFIIEEWRKTAWLPLREFWIPSASVKKNTIEVAATAFVSRFMDDLRLDPRDETALHLTPREVEQIEGAL